MPRLIYTLAFYVAQPFIWLRLLWRSRKQPEYLRHLGERYGYYPPASVNSPLLWLHAVSVGETRAAEPLIKALLDAYAGHAILLTHMTPTGRATGGELVEKYGSRLIQAYLPYDLPAACARFLTHFRPKLGLLMETELWPNLIATAHKHGVPLVLSNARLSARSQRGYARIRWLIRPALSALHTIAAQTAADAARLSAIGARDVRVLGNIKFDVTPSPEKLRLGDDWRRALGVRPIWLAASTREGEEELVLEAFSRLDTRGALLLIVPRHPQRFDEVVAQVQRRGFALRRRSDNELPDTSTAVWVGDSMGEMPAYFAVADLALMGGTLLPFGGQNLIEAAACGCPVLVGPHTFNFSQAAEDSIQCGAARRVATALDAAALVDTLLRESRELSEMRRAALEFSHAHQGATARTVTLIGSIIAPRTAD